MKRPFLILTASMALLAQDILRANPAEAKPANPPSSKVGSEDLEFPVADGNHQPFLPPFLGEDVAARGCGID